MSKTVLQVPLDSSLRKEAEQAALAAGFSSVQEVVRVFLKKLATQSVSVGFYEKEVQLSKQAEKRYAIMVNDASAGKNLIKPKTFDELISVLK